MAGHAVEFAGDVIERLSMEGRMTICNMTIEGGGRAGMIAPDETTFEWIKGRPAAPEDFEAAVEGWRALRSDEGATFDTEIEIDASEISPLVTWGTTPAQVVPVTGSVPAPNTETEQRALAYMALEPGTTMTDVTLDRVFIGSCTNSRIGDLRAAAAMLDGHTVHPDVRAMVVPGSEQVRRQAEAEGLHARFIAAGFEWRTAGCSMCPGMNGDTRDPGQRSGLGMAHRRLVHVPRHERGHAGPRRALREHLQPQLRGAPGPRWPHAPRLPADGRRRGDPGALRRHPGVVMEPVTIISGAVTV